MVCACGAWKGASLSRGCLRRTVGGAPHAGAWLAAMRYVYAERRRLPPQAHYILDEMCMNGCIVETNRSNVLAPIRLLEKAT